MIIAVRSWLVGLVVAFFVGCDGQSLGPPTRTQRPVPIDIDESSNGAPVPAAPRVQENDVAMPRVHLERIAQIPGSERGLQGDLAVKGKYVYWLMSDRLRIIDVAEPSQAAPCDVDTTDVA